MPSATDLLKQNPVLPLPEGRWFGKLIYVKDMGDNRAVNGGIYRTVAIRVIIICPLDVNVEEYDEYIANKKAKTPNVFGWITEKRWLYKRSHAEKWAKLLTQLEIYNPDEDDLDEVYRNYDKDNVFASFEVWHEQAKINDAPFIKARDFKREYEDLSVEFFRDNPIDRNVDEPTDEWRTEGSDAIGRIGYETTQTISVTMSTSIVEIINREVAHKPSGKRRSALIERIVTEWLTRKGKI